MRYIDKLNSDALQTMTLTGNAGQRISLTLRYMPNIKQWIYDVSLGEFILNGCPVLCAENLLNGYHNIIDFGLACWTQDGQDPRGVSDFETGYAALYLLSQSDVDDIRASLYG